MNDSTFRAANRAYDDGVLNEYLARIDEYDALQQWEQSVADRAAEMLAPDASESDKRETEYRLARAAASHSYAIAVLALMHARPLLAGLDVAPEARAVLNSLIDAANDAEVDARREIENEIRAGRLC